MTKIYTAFGKTLTLEQWAKQPECQVPLYTLRARVAMGRDMEDALTLDLNNKRIILPGSAKPPGPKVIPVYEAFGRSFTIREWSQHTGFSEEALRYGKKRQGSIENYLRQKRFEIAPQSLPRIRFNGHRIECNTCKHASKRNPELCPTGKKLDELALRAWAEGL